MKNRLQRIGGWVFLLPLVMSCNVYKVFEGSGSDQDHLEIGQKCESNGDFACAEEEFLAIGDPTLKLEKICKLYLSKAGFTLNAFATLGENSSVASKGFGKLANTFVPWSVEKQNAVQAAMGTGGSTNKFCIDYATAVASDPNKKATGVLLRSLGFVADCTLRMARTDQFQATVDDNTTDCDATTNRVANSAPDGAITNGDIARQAPSPDAPISGAKPGMCGKDVKQCIDDFVFIDQASLQALGLTAVVDLYNSVPAELKTSGTGTAVARAALYQQF